MDFSLAEIADIAEILGTFLIVVSLIFVGFELREGARQTKLSAFQTAVQLELNNVGVYIQNADTWNKVITGQQLEEGEETRKGFMLLSLHMLESSNRYQQFNSGNLSKEMWEARFQNVVTVSKLPIMKFWRKTLGAQNLDPDFMKLVDQLVAAQIQENNT